MPSTTVIRRALTKRTIASGIFLAIACTSVAFAVNSRDVTNNSLTGIDIKNNSITGIDVKNSSLTEADVKNFSLRGRDFVANSVTGNQVDESTLAKVPASTASDSATLADKAKGFTRIRPDFVTAFDAVDDATGRANAPFVTLVEAGSLLVQAKCFRNTTSDTVLAEVYLTTTVNGAIFDSREGNLAGGSTFANSDYLFTDSALNDRKVIAETATNNNTLIVGQDDSDFSALGIDGSWLRGFTSTIIRNGTPAGAPGTFYGSEHSCAFLGQVAHSGAA